MNRRYLDRPRHATARRLGIAALIYATFWFALGFAAAALVDHLI